MQTSRLTGTASKATRETTDQDPRTQPWPTYVTARILTRYGHVYDAFTATVDVYDDRAECVPCGWTSKRSVFRNQVLEEASEHAGTCMAMPRPTTNTAIHHSA